MRCTVPALVALSLLTAACGDPGSAELDGRVKALADKVERLEAQNREQGNELAALTRRIAGVQDDLVHVRELKMEPQPVQGGVVSAAGDEVKGLGAAGETPDAEGLAVGELAELLQTEAAKKAMADAVKQVEDERGRERSQQMVDMMVDRFAERANLSADQVTRMKEIAGRAMTVIREARTSTRDMGSAGPEERAIAREEALAKTEEVRQKMNEEVKLVLNSEQYALYEEEQDRMRGGFGGFGGRGPDGGGRGGRGGGR